MGRNVGKRNSAIWSLLLASGYLKVLNYTLNPEVGRPEYELCLTNKEVCLTKQSQNVSTMDLYLA